MVKGTALTRIQGKGRSTSRLSVVPLLLLATACSMPGVMREASPDEQALIDRAVELQVGTEDAGRAALLGASIPVVVYLPDLVCVAFKVKRSALGGEQTVCFSRADGSVASNHVEGQ